MKKLLASILLILTITVSLLLFSCGGGGVDGDEFLNVAVTDDGILSWTALNRATKYEVLNGKFGTGAPSEETTKPSFDLKKFNLTAGEHDITLLAIGKDPDLGVEAEFAVYEAVVTVTDGVYSIRNLTFSDEFLSLKNFEDADGVITNYIKPQFYSDMVGATYTSLAKEIKINGDNVWGLYSDSEYKSEVASQTITGLKRGHNYYYIKLNDRNGTFLRGYKLDFYILDKIDVKLYSALGSELATFSVWERDQISVADLYSKVPSDSYIAIGSKVIERGAGTVKPMKGDSFREITANEYKCLLHFDLSSDGVLAAKEGHDARNCTEEEIVIPKTILGREVKVLGNGDFNSVCNIKRITLPEGLVSISDYVFGDSLVSVNIPDSVTYIGHSAFNGCHFSNMGCTEVESVDGRNLVYIGKWLVSESNGGAIREGTVGIACEISSSDIKLPASLRYFDEQVFERRNLANSSYSETENGFIYNGKFLVGSTDELASGAEIREDTIGIMCYALSRSYSADEFIIPASVRYIHQNAFGYGVTDIGNFRVLTDAFKYENGILIDKDMTRICYISKNVTRLNIPDSVTEVCEGTRATITELHIGANVECNLKMPTSYLNTVTVSPENKRYTVMDGVLYYQTDEDSFYHGALRLICATKSVSGNITIPEGVEEIPSMTFDGNSSLTGVTLPESLTEIGWYAFRGTSITKITIPASVTEIGYRAFVGSALTEITFADTNGWKTTGGKTIDVTNSEEIIAFLKTDSSDAGTLQKEANN